MQSVYPQELPLHFASVVLVSAAMAIALYLIPVAGKAKAWVLLSVAFMLQAVNRVLELLSHGGLLLEVNTYEAIKDVLNVIGAACLFGGVFYIRAIFFERRDAMRQLEYQLDELRRFQQVSVGRELRMKELYEENQALKARLEERDRD